MAGTGKSYRIKQDLKKIDNYALTATTNRAARLVGGITIHSLLGLRIESGVDKNQIIKVGNAYDYIIIDEIGLLNEAMFEILYFLKVNTKIKLILVGDDKQLLPIEDKKYRKQRRKKQPDFFNSLAMKELVDFNRQTLVENKRSNDELWKLYQRIDELKPSDFGNEMTKKHITYTNKRRIAVNEMVMTSEIKSKKKKTVFIDKHPEDKNSQQVRLMVGSPVMAIRTNKKIGLFNGDEFTVSKLHPLTLKNTASKEKIEIDEEIFKHHCYIAYAITCYRIQGVTLNESYNIWEWNQMSNRCKYTAISRATAKDLINVIDDSDQPEVKEDIPETEHEKITRNKYQREKLEDPIQRRRQESHTILMNIINSPVTDDYSVEHTQKTRQELMDYLGIDNGRLPRGYSIDHIKKRSTCSTDEDFKTINYYTNLRLLPISDNIARNWIK